MSRLELERDGHDWPNREASRLVEAGGLCWHVQVSGAGPVLLLVHGTGAATHSWRDLLPLLAARFTVVAPDLPGHGFSSAPGNAGLSLPGMAGALRALLDALSLEPAVAVGHSAGAAILARSCLDGALAPRALVFLNGALLPLTGAAGRWFSPAARLLASNPVVPRLFAWRARDPRALQRLVDSTGSTLDRAGVTLYGRLVANPAHVESVLAMMAAWDLAPLERELPRLAPPPLLVVGERDRTVPPAESRRVQSRVPDARFASLPGLGHLAHEERPREVAALLVEAAREAGVEVGAGEA